MSERSFSGREGEEAAARHMEQNGFEILERNWHCRYGELDIIARRGQYLCFVEVKTRAKSDFAKAREFVTATKQRKCRAAASMYLAKYPTKLQPRFDVAEVYTAGSFEISYIENAF